MLERILNKDYNVSDIKYCKARDMFDFSSERPIYNGLGFNPEYKVFTHNDKIIAVADNEIEEHNDNKYVLVLFFCQNLFEVINDDRLTNNEQQISIAKDNFNGNDLLVDNTYLPLQDTFDIV